MTELDRKLIAIAKLALEAVGLESPPPATDIDRPEPARKVRRTQPKTAATPASKGPGKGNYPRKKRYECTACHHRFESKESLLDVTCPECDSTNIIKQPQERQI